jgi:hypothetical protein
MPLGCLYPSAAYVLLEVAHTKATENQALFIITYKVDRYWKGGIDTFKRKKTSGNSNFLLNDNSNSIRYSIILNRNGNSAKTSAQVAKCFGVISNKCLQLIIINV